MNKLKMTGLFSEGNKKMLKIACICGSLLLALSGCQIVRGIADELANAQDPLAAEMKRSQGKDRARIAQDPLAAEMERSRGKDRARIERMKREEEQKRAAYAAERAAAEQERVAAEQKRAAERAAAEEKKRLQEEERQKARLAHEQKLEQERSYAQELNTWRKESSLEKDVPADILNEAKTNLAWWVEQKRAYPEKFKAWEEENGVKEWDMAIIANRKEPNREELQASLNKWRNHDKEYTKVIIALRHARLTDVFRNKKPITSEVFEDMRSLLKYANEFFYDDGSKYDTTVIFLPSNQVINAFLKKNLEDVKTQADFDNVANFIIMYASEDSSEADAFDRGGLAMIASKDASEDAKKAARKGASEDASEDAKFLELKDKGNRLFSIAQNVFSEDILLLSKSVHTNILNEFINKKLKDEIAAIEQGNLEGFKKLFNVHKTFHIEYLEAAKKNPKASAPIVCYIYDKVIQEIWNNHEIRKKERTAQIALLPKPLLYFNTPETFDICVALLKENESMIHKICPRITVPLAAVLMNQTEWIKAHLKEMEWEAGYAYGEAFGDSEFVKKIWTFPSGASESLNIYGEEREGTKELNEQYALHLLDIALLQGKFDIVEIFYDNGAPDVKVECDYFWTLLAKNEKSMTILDWLIKQKYVTAQKAYDKALRVKSAPFAQVIEKKYPSVSFPKGKAMHLLLGEDDIGHPSPENAVEFAKYLISKKCIVENKSTGYSALGQLGLNLWYKNTLNKPAIFAVIKYLIDQGVNVKGRAKRLTTAISAADWNRVKDIAKGCATVPSILKLKQSDMGLSQKEVLEIIDKIEKYKESGALAQGDMNRQITAAFSNAFGNAVDVALTEAELKEKNIESRACDYIEEAMIKKGKIKEVDFIRRECDALAGVAREGNLELVKLLVEKGAVLPCVIIDDDKQKSIDEFINDDVKNYLRSAERKRNR